MSDGRHRQPVHKLRRPRPPLRRVAGWVLVGSGIVLFLTAWIGSYAGFVVLPFDRHHVITQIAGLVIASVGLGWATKPRR